jgi:lipoate-protein ligase A
MEDWRSYFDVEQFRPLARRHVVARAMDRPTAVLGSTQPEAVLDAARVARLGAAVVRRRSGGGVVFLQPGDHLWLDAWIPRDDPLWRDDVSEAAGWVGAWWTAAFGSCGVPAGRIHRGRAVPGPFGSLVCFAGRGPGEVVHDGRKVVGVSQWRSREGALFHSCAYTVWDASPLVDLLDLHAPHRAVLARHLAGTAVGMEGLIEPPVGLDQVRAALLDSFPALGTPDTA